MCPVSGGQRGGREAALKGESILCSRGMEFPRSDWVVSRDDAEDEEGGLLAVVGWAIAGCVVWISSTGGDDGSKG